MRTTLAFNELMLDTKFGDDPLVKATRLHKKCQESRSFNSGLQNGWIAL